MADDIDNVNAALNKLGEPMLTALTDSNPAGRLANATYAEIRDALLREFPWNFCTKRAEVVVDGTAPVWGYKRRYALPSDLLRLLEINNTSDFDWRVESGYLLTDLGSDLDSGAAQTFDYTAVDTTEDDITITAHGYDDEDGPFHLTTDGTLPTGTALLTSYYIEKVDADQFGLRATQDGAVIDLTAQGSGTHTITSVSALKMRYVSTTTVDDMDPSFREALAARYAMEWAEALTHSAGVVERTASLYRSKLQSARVADGQEDRQRVLDAPDFVESRW